MRTRTASYFTIVVTYLFLSRPIHPKSKTHADPSADPEPETSSLRPRASGTRFSDSVVIVLGNYPSPKSRVSRP